MAIAPAQDDTAFVTDEATRLLIKEARRKGRRRRLQLGVLFLLAFAVLVLLVIIAVGGASVVAPQPSKGNPVPPTNSNHSSVLVPRFDDPTAIATNGSDVWVVNTAGNSITEFSATTGSLVRVIDAKADAFHHPDGIAVGGGRIWVSNGNEQFGMGGGNYDTARYSSVTELNAKSGALVRVIDAKADAFLEPGPIAISGSHVWVLNQNASSSSLSTPAIALIELNATTGSLIHVFKTNVDGLYTPLNLTASRSDVWISNVGGPVRSVSEINSESGSLVRIIKATRGQLGSPDAIAVSGAYAWIVNISNADTSIAEIRVSNGSFVRVIKPRSDRFNELLSITAQTSSVWVTNDGSGGSLSSVIELDARTGSLTRIIKVKDQGSYGPSEIVAEGSKLWVLNEDSVIEMNQSNGSVVKVVK